jgi:hypothetical protein
MIDRTFLVSTDLFESVTPGAHFINPICFGEDFAAWLAGKLAAAGLPRTSRFRRTSDGSCSFPFTDTRSRSPFPSRMTRSDRRSPSGA